MFLSNFNNSNFDEKGAIEIPAQNTAQFLSRNINNH